jgi:pimeloyl-ACP methyl ester carboxylesterase
VAIYAVGHSLGGGLAQQAGYSFAAVRAVFSFNTSPVTNWTYLRLNNAIENPYPTIYRISHQGEALQKIRDLSSSLSGASYRRHDLTTQIYKQHPTISHSMILLSCTLAAIVADQPQGYPAAEFHFSRAGADSLFQSDGEEPGFCDREFREIIAETDVRTMKRRLETAIPNTRKLRGATVGRGSP